MKTIQPFQEALTQGAAFLGRDVLPACSFLHEGRDLVSDIAARGCWSHTSDDKALPTGGRAGSRETRTRGECAGERNDEQEAEQRRGPPDLCLEPGNAL